MVHTSIRISLDGTVVEQAVNSEDVSAHIFYNVNNRFGQFFMVDGVLHNKGYFTIDQAEELVKKWHDYRTQKEVKTPYH